MPKPLLTVRKGAFLFPKSQPQHLKTVNQTAEFKNMNA